MIPKSIEMVSNHVQYILSEDLLFYLFGGLYQGLQGVVNGHPLMAKGL